MRLPYLNFSRRKIGVVFYVNIDEKTFPRKRTNEQTDVSVQPTGKWIEPISQSEPALDSMF